MNFAYGVIAIVGVLAAIILGLIVESPDDIIEPRMISVEEKPTVCTMQWDPMCGVDGETYGNLCVLDAADVKFDYEGECVIAQPELEPTVDVELEEIVDASETTAIESESEVETLPMSLTVSIPEGAGGPGCEKTNECYSPYEVTVTVGTTVTWSNDDFLAHTVTSGNFPEHDGFFDSSVFMSGDTFEFTFDDVGDYDYYCFVHPWMDGIVHVS